MQISIQSQYEGTNVETIINGLKAMYEKYISLPINDFQRDIYDLDTATAAGLDCWGILLNFPRVIKGLPESDIEFHRLEDGQYRIILKLLAVQMFTRLTIPEINRYLQTIFGMDNVTAFCGDKQNMNAVNYVFAWEIPEWISAAFTNYNILPSPMGVGTSYKEANYQWIGYEGQELTNFYMAIYHPTVEMKFGFNGQNLNNFLRTKFYKGEE